MRPRYIALVALVLGLAVAGFFISRVLTERDTQRDSEHRAEVAAAQVRGRVDEGASLTQSLRRFMLDTSGTGVTSDQFARNGLRWLSPARFPAAAWVERVPDSRRAAYERRIGQDIVAPDESRTVVPPGSRSSYLPTTLVSGFPPMAVPGTDLSGVPEMATALTRATRLGRVAATPIAPPRTGPNGLFLVVPAPNLTGEILRQGYVVVFVSDLELRGAATEAPMVQIRTAGASTEAAEPAKSATEAFAAAGRRFDVVVPRDSVHGAAEVLPWIILAGGLVVAALGGALGLNAARRATAQAELDRIFTLSSDLITVANFNGYFTRVNPAAERILGYTEDEFLRRPYLDFVHPDDREKTDTEAAAASDGMATQSFENRYVRKDGSYRVLEWTSTPVVEDRLMYGVARDVTERRKEEAELKRLVDEQAALRRVATLVVRGVPAAEVFSAVAEELKRLFDAQATMIARLEPDGTVTSVGSSGVAADERVLARAARTGRAARVDDSVAVPIMVEGSVWGALGAATEREQFPPDAEQRMAEFTELVGTAIASIQARSDLAASRARIGAAADDERRRVVRDLHDGAQQRLVQTIMTLRGARDALQPNEELSSKLISEAIEQAELANSELRGLAQGLLPAVLRHGGLRAGVEALAARMPVPVEVEVSVDRLAGPVEATAYFVVAEALTNVAKHAHAASASVLAGIEDGHLRIQVRDDGIGGARPDGTGLVGLADRLAVLSGQLRVDSPAGGGTLVNADIPLPR